jgi:preprotein translocase subunit SecB
MSAEKNTTETTNIESSKTETNPSVAISGQYVKDLSFENPNAPMSLAVQKEAPKIEVSLNIEAKGLKEDTYEVSLHATAKATSEENVLFVVELSYAGLFTLTNVTAEQKELALLIHCPTILFPFARRVLADATRDGGFQPLMLEPIDFAALYQQRKAQEAAQSNA